MLEDQLVRWRQPPDPAGLAETVNFRTNPKPRVSVIVSVYNAGEKIDHFFQGLEAFTEEVRSFTEIVFVDSNSLDGTRDRLLDRIRKSQARGSKLSIVYARSVNRETIQKAWNRGIHIASADYLSFLGLDEMNRPDAFSIMADYLDKNTQIDWVQGSANVTEVNEAGSFVRDIMAYDRMFDTQSMHYLECCYISYVGALYRRSIHDRVGLYDERFKGAGDTEFKNRALPFIRAHTLPETLGTFLNYPEERTTQSPTAEIEDIRAWYLHRTPAGLNYALNKADGPEIIQLFHRALGYRKSYMPDQCTDVEFALSIAQFAKTHKPAVYREIEQLLPSLMSVMIAYRRFDKLSLGNLQYGLHHIHNVGGVFESVFFLLQSGQAALHMMGVDGPFNILNDNRYHQHHLLWPSMQKVFEARPALSHADLAGVQDMAEVFSSCVSELDSV